MKKQDKDILSIGATESKYSVLVGAEPAPGGLGSGTSSIFTCPVGVESLPVVYKLKPSKDFTFPVGKKSKSSKAFARPVDLKPETSNCFSFPVGLEWLTTSLTSEMVGSRAKTKLPDGSFSRNESVEYPISNIQYSIINNQSRKNTWVDNRISVALCDFSVYSVVKREESTTENHKENTKDHEERIKNFDEVENKYPISNIQYSILNTKSGRNTWADNTTSVALCDFSVCSVVKREDSTTENHKANTKDHEERTKNFDEVKKEYPISNIQYSILNAQSRKNTWVDNTTSVVLCDFSVYSLVKLIISNEQRVISNEQQATKYYKQSPHLPRGGFNSGDRPGAAAITIYSLFSSPRGTSCFAGSKRLAHIRSLPVINQQAFHQGSVALPDKGDKIRFSESGGLETYPDYRMKGFKTRKEVCRDIN